MEHRIVVFDLETGGLDANRHPIIQLGAIAAGPGCEAIEAFEAKIQFKRQDANKYSLRKNHFQPGVWAKEARPAKEVAVEFAEFLRRHAVIPKTARDGKPYRVAQLAAHNASFDGPFLSTWFKKRGVYLPARRHVLCTMQLAIWHFEITNRPPPDNFQLATLCKHFGVPFHAASAHEALADSTATLRLLRALLNAQHEAMQGRTLIAV